MRTEDLVNVLVADRAAGRRPVWRRLIVALAVGGLVSLALFVVEFGARTDLDPALATWRFDLKLAMVVLALVLVFRLCLALARPAGGKRALRSLVPLAAVAAGAVAIELATVPASAWGTRLVGSNSMICLTAIPLLALAPLAAILAALRSGAPSSPTLAGAAGGLLAAMAAATLYAFHCFDDSPLFVVTWYTLATVPVMIVGAVAGRRVLRW